MFAYGAIARCTDAVIDAVSYVRNAVTIAG
jgi:hypothetical protein